MLVLLILGKCELLNANSLNRAPVLLAGLACSKFTYYIIFGWESTICVLKITIAIVIVVFEIPIVNDSDSISHPCHISVTVVVLWLLLLDNT